MGVAGGLGVSVEVGEGPFLKGTFTAAVADAPVITGQVPLETPEDTPISILPEHLQVMDAENLYPTGFTLIVHEGDSYTRVGNVVTPVADFNGTLTIPVEVSDGVLSSNVFNLLVTVIPENDPPLITGQVPVSIDADESFTIDFSKLTVTDVDNDYPVGFSLSVAAGANYTVSGTTVTPVSMFTGELVIPVSVNDGLASSEDFNFFIEVRPAAVDPPVIIDQHPVTVLEDASIELGLSHLVVEDPGNVYPTGFTLEVSPGSNYTVSGTTVTPLQNFFGDLSVPVGIGDGTRTSETFFVLVEVQPVNDAPSFNAIADQSVVENVGAVTLSITGISPGPGENDQQLTFVATSGNTAIIETPVIDYGGGSTASLTYRVVPNTSGAVTITVIAIDNGSNTAPHENSYTQSFQVQVSEVNDAPTLDPINDFTVLEDASTQQITLAGIGPGEGETQKITVTAATDRPELFDLFEVAYNSPSPTAILGFKTKANAFGKTTVTVTVSDDGPQGPGHIHQVTRSFVLTVEGVNDPPVFTSAPVTFAVVGEPYNYSIAAEDVDGDPLQFSAIASPSWATLSPAGSGGARLHGQPPESASGSSHVVISVSDGQVEVVQEFTLTVNQLPDVSDLSLVTDEDVAFDLDEGFFQEGYNDANDDPLAAIMIVSLPENGKLRIGEVQLAEGDSVTASSLAGLQYVPDPDFFGDDAFDWSASDGYAFSREPATISITVVSVDDPPVLVVVRDTLYYEVNGEYAFVSPDIDIQDPDSDSLSRASVSFVGRPFRAELDDLAFQRTANIRGSLDYQTGRLTFSGRAPLEEYRSALRSVRYLHRNTVDPDLRPAQLVYEVNEGDAASSPLEIVISMEYTFVDLVIPTGFTPNGDEANDTWVIDWPGGGVEEIASAVVSVYTSSGVLVFRTQGFGSPWDGTMDGKLLPAGTYYYTIDLNLRNRKTYRGTVTILR